MHLVGFTIQIPYTYILAIVLRTNDESGSNLSNGRIFSEVCHSFPSLTTVNIHQHPKL
jgi:hypothetical protein